MDDSHFPRRFTMALRPGAYLRLLTEGDVGARNEIRVLARPDHALTIREMLRIYAFAPAEAERFLAVPQLSESWRAWAEERPQKTDDRPTDAHPPGCSAA